ELRKDREVVTLCVLIRNTSIQGEDYILGSHGRLLSFGVVSLGIRVLQREVAQVCLRGWLCRRVARLTQLRYAPHPNVANHQLRVVIIIPPFKKEPAMSTDHVSADYVTGAVPVDDPRLNPFPLYAQMRATSPVFFHPEQQVWLVYGYNEIRTIFSDPATFSSRTVSHVPGREGTQLFLMEDPPYHTKMRALVSRAF